MARASVAWLDAAAPGAPVDLVGHSDGASVGLLVAPSDLGGTRLDLAGAGACLVASVSWSLAAVRSRAMRLMTST